MAEYIVQDTTLTAIADAVRAKKGTTEPIALTDLATEIESIQSGSGSTSNKLALLSSANQEPYVSGYVDITADDLDGVTEIRDYAFYDCRLIKNVDLSNIERIGQRSFYGCYNVETVKFRQDGVIMQGDSFSESSIWQNNTDSDGYTVIAGNYCYYNGDSTDLVLPSGVRVIADNSDFPRGLTTIILPEGLEYIGINAFNHRSNLTAVEIPSTVNTIKPYAFSNSGITKIDLSKNTSLKEIPNWFCLYSSSITEIHLPNSIEEVGIDAFDGAVASNTDIYFYGGVDEWSRINFANNDSLRLSYCKNFYIDGEALPSDIVITGKYEKIGAYCFRGVDAIERVTIGEGVETIGNRSFGFCNNIEYIEFPSTIRSIDEYAFALTGTTAKKRTLVFNSKYCPYIDSSAFSNNNIELILVPFGSKESYEHYLSEYADKIEEMTVLGVSGLYSSTPALTRTDDAVGLSWSMDNNEISSDFDNYFPYNQMKPYDYHNGNDFGFDTYVYVPACYWRLGYDSDGVLTDVAVSRNPMTAAANQVVVRSEEFYYGAYSAVSYDSTGFNGGGFSYGSKSNSTYSSVTNSAILNTARSNLIEKRRGCYRPADILRERVLDLLWLIEFATKNSDSVMTGLPSYLYKGKTGVTDTLTSPSGQVSNSGRMRWRYIEDFIGNGFEYLDGNNGDYIATSMDEYGVAGAGIKWVNSAVENEYITALKKVSDDNPLLLVPSVTGIGSSGSYFCDQIYTGSGSTSATLKKGRGYNFGQNSEGDTRFGLFFWTTKAADDNSMGYCRFRVMYLPSLKN